MKLIVNGQTPQLLWQRILVGACTQLIDPPIAADELSGRFCVAGLKAQG
jgi:hypothetical protein